MSSVRIGSHYEESLRSLLTQEFEHQLERRIETESDFKKACKDYALLEDLKDRPVPIELKIVSGSCYLCCNPASDPVILQEGDHYSFTQTAFHQECLKKAAINYYIEGEFTSIPTLWHQEESAKLIRLFPDQ